MTRGNQIRVHGPEGFEGMRKAGRLAAECLDMLIPYVVPGVLTDELDRLAREFILDHGALPACLFYKGYSKTVCISPNHVVCHGIPGPRPLREGEIANIDVTVIVDGWHGDTSRMYAIGEIPTKARRLIDVTYEGMMLGLAQIKPKATPSATSATPFRVTSRLSGSAWCATSAAMAWASCSTTIPMSCTTARPGLVRCWSQGCSSPSNRWSTPVAMT